MANKVTSIRYSVDRTGESFNQIIIYRENESGSYALVIRSAKNQAHIDNILSTMVLDIEESGPSYPNGDFDIFIFYPAAIEDTSIKVNGKAICGEKHSYTLRYNDRDSVTLNIVGPINRIYNAIRHYQINYMLYKTTSPYYVLNHHGYMNSASYDQNTYDLPTLLKIARNYNPL
jgi:hypothetical protein